MAKLPPKIRKRFTSDMRIVVDFLAEGKNYIPTKQRILHAEAFLLLMESLTGDPLYGEMIQMAREKEAKGEEIAVCEVLDSFINRGIQQGVPQGEARMLVKAVDALMANLSFSLKQACESIGTSEEEYRKAKLI